MAQPRNVRLVTETALDDALADPDFQDQIKGPVGPAPALAAGTTTQVASGQPAEFALVQTGEGSYRVDAKIPKGVDGDPAGIADLGNAMASAINTDGSAPNTALKAQIDESVPPLVAASIASDDAPAQAAAAAVGNAVADMELVSTEGIPEDNAVFSYDDGTTAFAIDDISGVPVLRGGGDAIGVETFDGDGFEVVDGNGRVLYSGAGGGGGTPADPTLTAVSYGDSITAAGGYQPHVSSHLGLASYVNRGVAGVPMTDGVKTPATVTTIQANTDHTAFDLVTIASGTNDFKLNAPIGTIGDWASVLDRNTFYGAYRIALDHILTHAPEARIVICPPLKRNNDGYTDESVNTAGHMLRDYVEAVRAIGEMYGIPVCDWYSESGFNERTLGTFTNDGLHPNAAGHERLGLFMGDYIASILGMAPTSP